jgi:hypothetical protein
MLAADPPYWYEFRPPVGQELGPDLVRFTTLMGAYLIETIRRTFPDTTWLLGPERRGADYNHPLLGFGSGVMPDLVASVAWRALKTGDRLESSPGRLRQLIEVRMPSPSQPEPSGPPYEIFDERDDDDEGSVPGPHDWDLRIEFDHVVAHEQEGRVAAFVERLGHAPGIVEAVREDREIVLVRAPTLSVETLEPIVARAWEEVGRLS